MRTGDTYCCCMQVNIVVLCFVQTMVLISSTYTQICASLHISIYMTYLYNPDTCVICTYAVPRCCCNETLLLYSATYPLLPQNPKVEARSELGAHG